MHHAKEAETISANTRSPRADQSTKPAAIKPRPVASQMSRTARLAGAELLACSDVSNRAFIGITGTLLVLLIRKLERVKGIEPSYAAWEAAVLPLNYTRKAE